MPMSPYTRAKNAGIIIIGSDYDRWTVIGGPYKNGPHWEWLCRCNCGTEKRVRKQHLLSGASKGCRVCCEFTHKLAGISKEMFDKLSHAAEHAIGRCTDITHERYSDWGGRGIEVKFPNKTPFIKYLITLPGHNDPSLVIDRINNNGHYEVGNLRFTTYSVSNQNKRKPLSEKDYYIQHGFARCFKRLRDRGVSIRKIGELYGTSYGTVLRCT